MTKDIFAKFDKYLAGEMSDSEKKAFEAELETSSELKIQFLEFKTMVEAMVELPQYEEANKQAQDLQKTANAHYYATFKAYEQGSFTEKERLAFETKLKGDEWYAYQYEKFKNGLLLQVKEAETQQYDVPPKAKMISMRSKSIRYGMAASLLLLLGVFAWYLLRFVGIDTNEMYTLYNIKELYPKAAYALSNEDAYHKGIINSDNFVELKIEGLKAYEAQDWDKALNLLSQYLDQAEPTEEETPDEINVINLYTGLIWLEKGNVEKAITALTKAERGVQDEENYRFMRESMRWFLALAHLKNKDISASKNLLYLLTEVEDEIMQRQAKNLLKELE